MSSIDGNTSNHEWDSSALTRDTVECKELVDVMHLATQMADKLIAEVSPSLPGERYLTT